MDASGLALLERLRSCAELKDDANAQAALGRIELVAKVSESKGLREALRQPEAKP